jgi:hypothetical protein
MPRKAGSSYFPKFVFIIIKINLSFWFILDEWI